ncbi:MAG: hypothetical protein JSS97_13475, partial [Actinobacteria bacterium]|nr:hypothetical protein [Actinomycetota bacterium]
VVLAGMAVAGAADGVWTVAHENLVQRITPDEIRSRVFAAGEAVYYGGISVGIIGASGSIAVLGAAGTFRIGALASMLALAVLVATAAALARTYPKAAPRGRRGAVPPPPPASTAAFLPAGVGESLSPTADQRTG